MKKLSIEQKAKAYDAAFKRARNIRFGNPQSVTANTVCEEIFPELKESEDERIREAILSGLKYLETELGWDAVDDVDILDVYAWLGKQGEQKPIPPVWKYKKDHLPLPCDSITLNKYGGVGKSPSGALVSGLWVLDFNELAKLPKEEIEKQGEQKSIWHNEDEEPQRDSLILLIMQSGTPIVVKIIEPNHTFNHGEKWAYIDDLLEKNRPQGKSTLESWKDMRLEVYQQASGNRHEPNCSDDTTKMFSLNDIDEIFEKIAEKKELKKLGQQEVTKTSDQVGCEANCTTTKEWSEEDEKMLDDAIGAVCAADYYTYDDKQEIEKWLKSLKQRIGG